MSTNPHIGSSFADFLKEEGIYDEVTVHGSKRVLAWWRTFGRFWRRCRMCRRWLGMNCRG